MADREFVRGTPRLGGMVTSAVGYRSTGVEPGIHRGLPSPYLTLIFSFDGPVTAAATPEGMRTGAVTSTEIVLGGLHQSPAYIAQPRQDAGIQLAVHPLAARTLFGLPSGELTGALVCSGPDVLGGRATEALERMRELPTWEARFALLGDYLRRRAADSEGAGAVRPEVAEAWAWLARHRGAGTVRGLAAHVSLSPRRLTDLFRAETGVSPKQAARLMRFERAMAAVVRAAAAGRRPELAAVAADCGYYDHSHLVRDFQQYTGTSPTAWLDEECRNIQAGGHRNGEG